MANKGKKRPSRIVNIILAVICLVWLIPTLGLFISSFRPADEILKTGWWTIFPHRTWETSEQAQLPKDLDLREPIVIDGKTYSNDELRKGVVTEEGYRLIWENPRARLLNVQERSWGMNTNFTLENYKSVLTGKEYEIAQPDGGVRLEKGSNLSRSFWNTMAVSIPGTVIPILIASFAAYAFAWMKFPGSKVIFVIMIALLVVPLQVALIPVLKDYTALGLNGSLLGIWLAHTAFGLPLITYFMYNYISQLPGDIFESAYLDGASNFTIFTRLVLPLSVPALASIGIFQFLWVWNDYLVALVFIGSQPDVQVLSMRIAELVGSRGSDWHLLTAAAFISMIMPLMVFFFLQKYFVRGLLGGSIKG